jgi:hypothetical protein
MKNIQILSFFTLLLFTFSCVERDYDFPDLSGDCFPVDAPTRIRNVNQVFTSATSVATLFDNLNNPQNPEFGIVEGYVVSSDLGGNFFKSISVLSLDGTRGFNVPIDARNESLVRRYEPGRRVTVELKGLYYAIDNGALSIGDVFENNRVGRISNETYAKIVKRNCEVKDEEELVVKNLSITQAKNDIHLHKLIEFDNVQFTDNFVGKTYFDATNTIGSATNNLIADANGNSVIVRVSQFTNFGNSIIPNNSGKVRGVMTKFGSDYQFMVRTLADVKLTNNRIVPIFDEKFANTASFNNWVKVNVTGAQDWVLETAFGNPAPCARMNGFASGSVVNEDWLISPSINLNNLTQATLTFQTASRFSGPLLEVLVSTNYTTGAPTTATWTPLTGFTLDTNTGSFIWTNSGPINLAPFLNNSNFRIAFKYTSTSSAATNWQVDNVTIIGQ